MILRAWGEFLVWDLVEKAFVYDCDGRSGVDQCFLWSAVAE